jgi:hypothetical protein
MVKLNSVTVYLYYLILGMLDYVGSITQDLIDIVQQLPEMIGHSAVELLGTSAELFRKKIYCELAGGQVPSMHKIKKLPKIDPKVVKSYLGVHNSSMIIYLLAAVTLGGCYLTPYLSEYNSSNIVTVSVPTTVSVHDTVTRSEIINIVTDKSISYTTVTSNRIRTDKSVLIVTLITSTSTVLAQVPVVTDTDVFTVSTDTFTVLVQTTPVTVTVSNLLTVTDNLLATVLIITPTTTVTDTTLSTVTSTTLVHSVYTLVNYVTEYSTVDEITSTVYIGTSTVTSVMYFETQTTTDGVSSTSTKYNNVILTINYYLSTTETTTLTTLTLTEYTVDPAGVTGEHTVSELNPTVVTVTYYPQTVTLTTAPVTATNSVVSYVTEPVYTSTTTVTSTKVVYVL